MVKSLERDPREPDRAQKERLSRMITRVIAARFASQRERLRFQLSMHFPGRVAKAIQDPIDYDIVFGDGDEAAQEIIAILLAGAQGGIQQTALETKLILDYGMVNVRASKWARTYAYKLIKDLDAGSRQVVRSAITNFVNDPNYTMKDLIDVLEPEFSRVRAERIAVTEVTRSYSQGQQMAGDALREQWPGVRIVDRWYTNADDRVCPLCGDLDGAEVEHGEKFYDPEDDTYLDGYPPRHVNCRCWMNTTTRIDDATD